MSALTGKQTSTVGKTARRSLRRRIWVGSAAAAVLVVAALVLVPRLRATLRLVGGFEVLPGNSRVYFEPGGRAQAEELARSLPEAITRVERLHGRPFRAPFRVYLCSTHAAFCRRTGLPEGSPVRGFAFLRDVWISPLAFEFRGFDTHESALSHELSHLHLGQYLGWFERTRKIPTWFSEGLADVASGTGFEIVSRAEGLRGLAQGPRFEPDGKGRWLWPRPLTGYGLSPPGLHSQARLFVEYLAADERFPQFVVALSSGEPFESAFREHLGRPLESAWRDFLRDLPDA